MPIFLWDAASFKVEANPPRVGSVKTVFPVQIDPIRPKPYRGQVPYRFLKLSQIPGLRALTNGHTMTHCATNHDHIASPGF